MPHANHTMGCCGPVTSDAPLAVTINPEARVSTVRTFAPIATAATGEWFVIPFEILNEGYVTGPLSVDVRATPSVDVFATSWLLTGERSQFAEMRMRMGAQVTDVSLTFSAESARGGLANHSAVSFLLRSRALAHAPGSRRGLTLIGS